MQTGSRVGRGVAWRVCSKSDFASATVGRISSFVVEAMVMEKYGSRNRGPIVSGCELNLKAGRS